MGSPSPPLPEGSYRTLGSWEALRVYAPEPSRKTLSCALIQPHLQGSQALSLTLYHALSVINGQGNEGPQGTCTVTLGSFPKAKYSICPGAQRKNKLSAEVCRSPSPHDHEIPGFSPVWWQVALASQCLSTWEAQADL